MIELVKPDWIAGSEKRFFDFISTLGGEKVALISHGSDLDGLASAKVVSKCLSPDILKLVSYPDLNSDLSAELKKLKVKKIIICDLYVKSKDFLKSLESFAEVLIIDHHQFEENWNSERTVFMNAHGFCAAYLSYYLFSRVQNIENFDWVVACASITDFAYEKNSSWMTQVYEKYGEEFNNKKVEQGKFWEIIDVLRLAIIYLKDKDVEKIVKEVGESFGDLGNLHNYSDEVRAEINSILERFEKEKQVINGRVFFEYSANLPLSSFISTELSIKDKSKTFIIMDNGETEGMCKLSLRRQDKKENLDLLIRELINGFDGADGGGHIAASGGFFPQKYKEEFKKRLKNL